MCDVIHDFMLKTGKQAVSLIQRVN